MIKIFNGYEIDGSDTSFYLLTDKKELLPKLIDYFITMPIFDRGLSFQYELEAGGWAPHRSYDDKSIKFMFDDFSEHKKSVLSAVEKEQNVYFVLPCKIPILLPKNVRKELFEYTETRPGGKKEYTGMTRPEGELQRGAGEGASVFLSISFRKDKFDFEVDGMILNQPSLEKLLAVPTYNITLGCGPSFYYEYAAWIMNKISSEFPEIGICGGLDCGGAFTGGCTYANTIYAFERFDLPWKKAEYAIGQLKPYFDLARAHSSWKPNKGIEYYNESYLSLANSIDLLLSKYLNDEVMFDFLSKAGEKQNAIKKDKYQEFCTKLYSDPTISDEELIAATASILLLKPEQSNKQMKDHEKYWDEYQRQCYLVSVRKDGHISCELWVSKQNIEKAKKILEELGTDENG